MYFYLTSFHIKLKLITTEYRVLLKYFILIRCTALLYFLLVFLTVHNQLIYCQVITELNKVSDHKLIKMLFYFNIKMRESIKHRA